MDGWIDGYMVEEWMNAWMHGIRWIDRFMATNTWIPRRRNRWIYGK